MSTSRQPTESAPVTVPWWRNPTFAAAVGGWALALANANLHLGLPTDITTAGAIGLGLLWAVHTIVLDVQVMGWRKALKAMEGIDTWKRLLAAVGPDLVTSLVARFQAETAAMDRWRPPAPAPEPSSPSEPTPPAPTQPNQTS